MENEKISRLQFLRNLGLGGSALMAVYCASATLTSCTNESVTPSNGSLTLDLTDSANAALTKSGGYIVKSNIVVANTGSGYVAVTQVCSHEGLKEIIYNNGEFYCTAHGARYNTSGVGLNSNGRKGITVYKTSLSGNVLTVS